MFKDMLHPEIGYTSSWSVNASIADSDDSDSFGDGCYSKQAEYLFDIENQQIEILRDNLNGDMDNQPPASREHLTVFAPKREDSLEFQFKNIYEFWKPYSDTFLGQNLQVYCNEEIKNREVAHSLNTAYSSILNGSSQIRKSSQEEFQRKKVGRKHEFTGLSQRKDVVLKSILRKIRKYLWRQFNEFTKFMKQKYLKEKDFYERCLIEFIKNIIQREATAEFVLILGGLLSFEHMKELIMRNYSRIFSKSLKSIHLRKIDEIYDLLYKFTLTKYVKFAKRKEVHIILNYFYNFCCDTLESDEKIGIQLLTSLSNMEEES